MSSTPYVKGKDSPSFIGDPSSSALEPASAATRSADGDGVVTPQQILDKWNARLAQQAGHGSFLRHLDGNLSNCASTNLECVHPFDAFRALHLKLGWAVDWAVGLTDEEQAFVRAHLWNFAACYQTEGAADEAEEHDADGLTAAEAHILSLSERADAAMQRGEYEVAVSLLEAAKGARERILFGAVHPTEAGGDTAGRSSKTRSLPAHGRRSVALEEERVSILSSKPSRRQQRDGQPSKREEVAARIAARSAALGR